MGLRWLRTHLTLIPRLLTLRAAKFWQPPSPVGGAGMTILRPVAVGYPALAIALALPGLLALLRRRQGAPALIFCISGATVIAGGLVIYGSPHMRSSLEPFLVTLAAGALVYWPAPLRALLQRGCQKALGFSRRINGMAQRSGT
jgi:hypothetical protein